LKEAKTCVSVLICVRNVEKYIADCIASILDQTYRDFELIIVDDSSDDNTKKIIEKFKDERIRYFRNEKWLGISKSRNLCVKYAKGDNLFFTDGDCIVSRDWIEQGLMFLKNPGYAGVEGKIYYVSEKYEPTFSDHSYSRKPGGFMTGNMAYKKRAIENVGGFDERYSYNEDKDLAFRILRIGKIKFNPNMIVFIQKQVLTPKQLVKQANIIKNRVYLFKRFGDKDVISWRIIDPWSLAKLLCPPLVFTSLFFKKFETADDYKLLPYTYVQSILARLQLWRECAKERVFLI
jgi:glycosyltransferase involved in cell wall biosynthesis